MTSLDMISCLLHVTSLRLITEITMKQETSTSNYSDKAVDLSMYNNEWYRKQIGATRFKQVCWYLVNATLFFHPIFAFSGFKVFLLRKFGAQIGKQVVIKRTHNTEADRVGAN